MLLSSKKIPRSSAAFTLFEVALAATVLLFAIVSAFQLVVVGTRMLDFSRKQTIAAQIIHSEIDKVHTTDWTTVSGYPASATITINSSLSVVATGFTCTRAVSSIKTDGTLYKIVFTVTWTARSWTGGVTRTYSRQGTTYVGKNGLSATYQRS
jgi:hypothetical protein